MLCSLSTKLSQADVEKINSLEKELGTTLLAFSCHDTKAADIEEDKIKKIQELEKAMGVNLVAV